MQNVVEAAKGRWREILVEFGVNQNFLNRHHGPCPFCGGDDRYRFDDKGGRGTFYCSQCGPGDGFDFLARLTGQKFIDLKPKILEIASTTTCTPPPPDNAHHHLSKMRALWHRAKPPASDGPVERYMMRRLGRVFQRPAIREAKVWHPDANAILPTMLCLVTTTTGEPCALHATYLTTTGEKADVKPSKGIVKGGKLPPGCAIRLSRVESSTTTPTIGIAEGVETALSCEILFGIPVWAAGNAGVLSKWSPPPHCNVVIFGDCDKSYTGQAKAYDLANQLTVHKKATAIVVRLPLRDCGDWNDELKERLAAPNPLHHSLVC